MASYSDNLRTAAHLLCAVGLGCSVLQVSAQYEPDWTHQIRLGAMMGLNIKADFRMLGEFAVSGSQPGPTGVSGVDHVYDDGYVRVDQTGNAQGYSSYWGYTSASQYDATSHTLTMHSTTSFSTLGSSSKDESPYWGVELGYGANPWRWGQARVGFEFGLGYLPVSISDNQTTPAVLNRSAYSFDTGGILMPAAPYHGGPSGIGPTIHDVATAQGTSTIGGTINGSRTLDAPLFTLRLGPALYWDLSRFFGVSVAAGPAIGIIPETFKYRETATFDNGGFTQNQGDVKSTQFAFGGYVGATFTYHAVTHGDLYVAARYMPMGTTTLSGGGREARLHLDGQLYISAGFNWPF